MTSQVCQSCGLPLLDDLKAYESNGTRSEDYCKYCYASGRFAEPKMTMEDMVRRLAMVMNKMGKSENEIMAAAENVPNLKRWKQ